MQIFWFNLPYLDISVPDISASFTKGEWEAVCVASSIETAICLWRLNAPDILNNQQHSLWEVFTAHQILENLLFNFNLSVFLHSLRHVDTKGCSARGYSIMAVRSFNPILMFTHGRVFVLICTQHPGRRCLCCSKLSLCFVSLGIE